ncbi:WD40-repeat-containing domain protein, partial [Lanmaoa asiatica]
HRKGAKPIVINSRYPINSIAFFADGKHVVGGGMERKIRRWRVEDGREVGTPMDAGSVVVDIAVSQDGKWVVSGTSSGQVIVWNAETHEKVTEFKGHEDAVFAVDVSPDATKIATGSDDKTACVWSLTTSQQLVGPWRHDCTVTGVKFSPDGCLIATAAWFHDSVRIYDNRNGRLLVDVPISVGSCLNQTLAWTRDSRQLFTSSDCGYINCLDVSTGTILSRLWATDGHHMMPGRIDTSSIALASNGTFIAAPTRSSVSFWDTTTHEKIEPVIEHTGDIMSGPMAISSNHNLATCSSNQNFWIYCNWTITLQSLRDILPSPYSDIV